MGSLYSPQVLPLGSSEGQIAEAQPQNFNYCRNGVNIAAVNPLVTQTWAANGAATLANLPYSFDNGFNLTQLNAIAGVADFYALVGQGLYTTTSVPAKATDRINTFSAHVLQAPAGTQSPQCRFEARLTGGVARNLSVDFNPQTGVLIASNGNPNTVGIIPITIPLLNGVENVRAWRVFFSCDVVANNAAELRLYPRSDGGAAGSAVFGGIQIDGQVSNPLAFCTSEASATLFPSGVLPHQTLSPRMRVRYVTPVGPAHVPIDPRSDQDTWIEVSGAGTLDLPQVTANTPDMPTGAELLITPTNALNGGFTLHGAANAIVAFVNGSIVTFTDFIANITIPNSSTIPGVVGLRLIKTQNANEWLITELIYNNAFNTPQWQKFTLGFAAFQAAALANSVALFQLPAGGVLHAVKIKHSAAFTGAGIATCTMEVGILGNTNKYAGAFNVLQAPGNTIFQMSGPAVFSEDNANPVQVYATARSTGANLANLATGSVDIWALLSTAL